MKAFITLLAVAASASAGVRQATPFGNLPLRFEENRGQEAPGVRYIARGNRFNVLLKGSGNAIRWTSGALETTLVGANRNPQISALSPLAASTNYFKGNQPQAWTTGVHNFERVRYTEVYPGIDMVFYGREGRLEYDFVVRPGADPSVIQWKLDGFDSLAISPSGELVVSTAVGDIRWKAPEIYQQFGNERVRVDGRFALNADRVTFQLGPYDHSKELVIDPVLSFSTFLGGTKNEGGSRVVVDSNGNVYVTGTTVSQDFPVTRTSFQPSFGGTALGSVVGVFAGDVFVAKFSSTGALVYLSYLGGSIDEAALGLAVDSTGSAYVGGYTNSSDFPTAGNPLQKTFGGFGGNFLARFGDGFISKLSPAGDQLLYSTYLGGRSDDMVMDLKIDSSSNIYVTGWTISNNFPITTGAYQSPLRGAGGQSTFNKNGVPLMVTGDVFVTKIKADGSALVFSSIIGGTMDDIPTCLILDSSNNVYVGGSTISMNFPVTAGSFQQTNHGSDPFDDVVTSGDAFILKLDSTGQKLVFSTYMGGRGDDIVGSLAIDSTGNLYATGGTNSSDFPITNRRGYAGPSSAPFTADFLYGDGFVAKIKPDGSGLLFSSFIGGSQDDEGTQIALDPSGNIVVAGNTASLDLPVTSNAMQTKLGGGLQGDIVTKADGFLMVFSPAGDQTLYSSYIGGTLGDVILGMTVDKTGNTYITGFTTSADYPITTGAFQRTHTVTMDSADKMPTSEDQTDVFLTKIAGLVASPLVSAVVNGASGVQGAVSPGMIAVFYGSLIGPTVSSPVLAAVDPVTGLLATTRSNTTFFFDNVAAPIVYVSATQSAAIVPYEVAGKGSTQLTAQFNGQTSPPVTLSVNDTMPGLFTVNQAGTGPAVVYNQDGTLNSASNPAPKNTAIQLYGTGEGLLTSPTVKTGQIAPLAPPFPTPVQPVSATIGGANAQILYKGPVPGFVVGLLQVNMLVPATAPSGIQPVVLQVGSNRSPSNVTVAIQ
jgi:uncharacterized protein (TIGR03437 family)